MGDLDDEWERSEEALKKLQIEPQINEPGVFFSSSTTTTNITTTNASLTTTTTTSTSNTTSTTTTTTETTTEFTFDGPDAPLTSVLIDALQNPRERMNVLKYEDRILKFVKSK